MYNDIRSDAARDYKVDSYFSHVNRVLHVESSVLQIAILKELHEYCTHPAQNRILMYKMHVRWYGFDCTT